MLTLACCISAGIALADFQSNHSANIQLSLALLCVTGLIWGAKARRWRFAIFAAAIVLAFTCHSHRLKHTRDHPWRQWLTQQQRPVWAEVEGEIVQALNRSLPGFESDEALLKIHRIIAAQRETPLTYPAYFELRSESPETLKPGRYVMTGWLSVASPPDNPGQFDRRDYQQRLGLIGDFRLSHLLESHPKPWDLRAWLIQRSESCREWITAVLSRHLPQESPEFVILLAMALGATDTATPEMQIPFRLSGTLHIFAVSGLHVAIIGVIFWALLKSMGVSRGSKFLLIIPLVFAYAFLTGMRPSALRAAFMTSVFLMGACVNRRSDLLNSLGTAAVILLIIDTQQLFMPGFQLSFGVLAAIGLFNALFMQPLRGWVEPDPYMPRTLLNGLQRTTWQARRYAAGLFTMSASSWVGSLGLMFHHFHSVTPGGLLANLVLVPLAFSVLSSVVLQLLFSWLGPLQQLLSSGSYWLAKLTLVSAHGFSMLPWGNFYLPNFHESHAAPAQLTVLRLPGADAAHHLRAGGEHWLLDCGSERQFPYALQTYLTHQGINKIDRAVLSHADVAHQGAAAWLYRYHDLQHVFAPHAPPKTLHQTAPGLNWEILAAEDHFTMQEDDAFKITGKVLFPPKDWRSRKADDRSLILQLHIGPHKILWCSDSGFMAEKYLLQNYHESELRSDIIIRNHHADDFSMLPDFLKVIQPRAIISSNPNFPATEQISPMLKQSCKDYDIQLWDQMETGAVSISCWSDRMELRSYKDPSATTVIKAP